MIGIIQLIVLILDKFVPGRKEALNNEIRKLEKELAESLIVNDTIRVDIIRARLSELRKRASLLN
jgi:hypothetical protein